MPSDKPESSGLLAMIDAKIAALQQLRESVIQAIAVGAFGVAGELDLGAPPPSGGGLSPANSQSGAVELPTGVFRNKGLADAIRLYFSMAKRKQTQKDIKSALMDGGLATTSEFFDATLNSTLHRMAKAGELLKFKDGWDLAESYPPAFRQRLQESKEETPRRKRKARQKKAEATRAVKTKRQDSEPATPAGSNVQPIRAVPTAS